MQKIPLEPLKTLYPQNFLKLFYFCNLFETYVVLYSEGIKNYSDEKPTLEYVGREREDYKVVLNLYNVRHTIASADEKLLNFLQHDNASQKKEAFV